MKKLIRKILKEAPVTRFPQQNRGEVIVCSSRDVDYDMAKKLAIKLGYDITGESHDYCYVVKTPVGEEEQSGQDFIDNYPEFFNSWEREDNRYMEIVNIVDNLKEEIDYIEDFFEYSDRRRFINEDEFNEHIDKIIGQLNKLKF